MLAEYGAGIRTLFASRSGAAACENAKRSSRPLRQNYSEFAQFSLVLMKCFFEFTLSKFRIYSKRLQVSFLPEGSGVKKVAPFQNLTKMEVEALASMLMASAVSTALLKEVRASVSVGGGGRRR